MEQLLQEILETLEHIVSSEEWETLQHTSSADVLISEIQERLK